MRISSNSMFIRNNVYGLSGSKNNLNTNSKINKSFMPICKKLYKNDAEITLELDRKIYNRCSLKKLKGFEFNSAEFIKWKKENAHYSTVPMDAPVKIRKTLTDMIDLVPTEGALRFRIAEAIKNKLESYDTTNPDSFVKACDDIIQDNKDYIYLVKICGSDSPLDIGAIESSIDIINFMIQFKNKIS